MQRELLTADGAMLGSLSALDDSGIEGGYYLWSRDELNKLLEREENEIVQSLWLGKSAAPFDGGYLPVWQQGHATQQKLDQSGGELLESARLKMLQKRQQDRRLPVDDKLLAGWNGLALSAFSLASKTLVDAELRNTADSIAGYIKTSLMKGNVLFRAYKAGKPVGQASLADYAYVAEGLWDYYQLTGSKDDRLTLQSIIDTAWQQFYTDSGWSMGKMSAIQPAGRQGIIPDGAQASPSSVLLDISYKLAKDTGNRQLEEEVIKALGFEALGLSRNSFWYASQVRVIADVLSGPEEMTRD